MVKETRGNNLIRFTYLTRPFYVKLRYLTEVHTELRKTKIDIVEEAMDRLFNRVKPYKDLLSTKQYQEFEMSVEKTEKKARENQSKN